MPCYIIRTRICSAIEAVRLHNGSFQCSNSVWYVYRKKGFYINELAITVCSKNFFIGSANNKPINCLIGTSKYYWANGKFINSTNILIESMTNVLWAHFSNITNFLCQCRMPRKVTDITQIHYIRVDTSVSKSLRLCL